MPTEHLRAPWHTLRRTLQGLLRPAAAARATPHCLVSLHDTTPVHTVDPCYLSYSIDISVIAGGFWWEGNSATRKGLGTIRIPPLNLNNAKLDTLAQKLSPAYLRVGGSEADRLHYFDAPSGEPGSLVLTKLMWDNLQAFIERNHLRLSFTFKYGLFKRELHGKWQASEIETLLRHTCEHGQTIEVCELGNELNAYWAFHGITAQPRARDLAADYHVFIQVIKKYLPQARIIGPGSAFWPKLGETIRPFSNITQKFLQECAAQQSALSIVDWHYYPFQSHRSPVRTRAARLRSFLKPQALNDFGRYLRQLKEWRDVYMPNADIWTGETGSAQCGGEPKLSDRFVSCFWWADQLGQGARLGQKVMIRQSLIGGEYGMVDRLTLKPRPDYWLSWLWKQLMGIEVFAVDNSHHMLRAYCHNAAHREGKTLCLINLSARVLQLQCNGFGRLTEQYVLTAKRLQSKKVRINKLKARFQKGRFDLQSFAATTHSNTLPGHSISFWVFEPN